MVTKGIRTAIVERELTDRHTGKPPYVLEVKSVYQLRKYLFNYMHRHRVPSYRWVLKKVKEQGYIELLKRKRGNYTHYTII